MLSRENMKFSPWNDHFEKVLGVDFNTASHYYELVRNSVSKYFRTKSVRVYTTSKPKNSQTLLSVGSFSPSDNLNKVNKEIPIDLSSGIGNFQNSGIHNVDRIQSKMNDIKDLINNFDKPSYLDNRKEPQVEDVERVRNKSIGPSFKSSSLVLEKRNSNAYECRKGESNLVWNEAKRPYIYSFNDSYRIPSIPEENLPRDNTSNKQAARDNTRVSIPIEINDQANSDLISRTRKIFSNSSTKEIDLSAKIIQNYNPGYIVKRPKHSEFNFDYSKSAKFYEEDSSHRPDSSEYITYSNSSKLNFIDQTGKYGDHLNNYGGSYARDADLFQYKDKELLKKSDDYTVYHRRSNYGICDRLSEVSSKPVKNLHSTKNICNEYLRNNSELSYDIGSNPLMNSQGLKHIYKS